MFPKNTKNSQMKFDKFQGAILTTMIATRNMSSMLGINMYLIHCISFLQAATC